MIEFVLILHFLVILFVIFGFPVGLYCNLHRFRIFHACLLAYISTLMVLGKPCPLTILEEHLRGRAVYEGSFIATWLHRIIYVEGMAADFVVYLSVAFLVLVASSFFWKPLRWSAPRRNENQEQ